MALWVPPASRTDSSLWRTTRCFSTSARRRIRRRPSARSITPIMSCRLLANPTEARRREGRRGATTCGPQSTTSLMRLTKPATVADSCTDDLGFRAWSFRPPASAPTLVKEAGLASGVGEKYRKHFVIHPKDLAGYGCSTGAVRVIRGIKEIEDHERNHCSAAGSFSGGCQLQAQAEGGWQENPASSKTSTESNVFGFAAMKSSLPKEVSDHSAHH